MLLEVPLSMVAWLGVVIVQAIVHFGLLNNGSRKRDGIHHHPPPRLGGSSFLLLEEDDDEEPPEIFDELLDQTGDEVISFIRSNSIIERRAQEQLDREKEE